MDKHSGAARSEIERGKYVMQYGNEWVKHWWKDHPGVFL